MRPFDETKYYLGSLCKRGHDYDGTEKSLRSNKNRTCFYCRIENQKNTRFKKSEYNKKYRLENTENIKKYIKKNSLKIKKQQKEYIKKHDLKIKKQQKEYRLLYKERKKIKENRYVKELVEAYIATQLIKRYDIKRSQIPPEMIEIKREQLMLFREIQQYKKEINDGITTR